MDHQELGDITIREKLVVIFVVFLIRMLKPWTYDHQFTEFWSEIKMCLQKELKIKDK